MSTNRSKTVERSSLAARTLSPDEMQEVKAAAKSRSYGAAAMRHAADEVLLTNSAVVAQALVDSAIEGHMMAARLLYLIANDELTMTAEEIRKRKSLAALWRAELDFEAEMKQLGAETQDGSHEPEFSGTTIDAPKAEITAC
jgi:hypothetical protein